MHGIKDKVVVITGASSGIGEATSVMLVEQVAPTRRVNATAALMFS